MKIKKPSFKLKNSDHVYISPSGRYLAQKAGSGSRVTVWDIAERKIISAFKAIPNEDTLCFSPDEKILAVKNKNGEIAFCDPLIGSIISKSPKNKHHGIGCQPCFSYDGDFLVDGDWDGNLMVWDIRNGSLIYCKSYKNHMIHDIRYSKKTNSYYAVVYPKHNERGGTRLLQFKNTVIENEGIKISPANNIDRHSKDLLDIFTFKKSDDWIDIITFEVDFTEDFIVAAVGKGGIIDCTRIIGIKNNNQTEQRYFFESGKQNVWSIAIGKEVIAIAVDTHNLEKGMSYSEWIKVNKEIVNKHIYFIDKYSFNLIAIIPWRDVYDLDFHPSGIGMAIGSYSNSVYVADFEQTVEGVKKFVRQCEEI